MPKRTILFLAPPGDPRGPAAVAALAATGGPFGAAFVGVVRDPAAVTADESTAAAAVVSFADPAPATAEQWGTDPIPDRVNRLLTRLLGGEAPAASRKPAAPKKSLTAKVGRETAGRRGKGVTTVFDLPLSEDELKELAATLKNRCGTGGTVKDGRIEIQGDIRDRVAAELEKLGYKVKRAGG